MILASSSSLSGMLSYLDGHWTGGSGFLDRLAQHVGYSVEILAVSIVLAIPLGLVTGHTGRGGAAISMLSNASQALPTLGLLTVFAILFGIGFKAAILPLIFVAVPSMLVNTNVGIRGVDRALVDAAYGMGLTSRQVLWRVEVPVALPLIVLGLRTAALQVVSTTTIAAFLGAGGLGTFINAGSSDNNSAEVGAGALAVAVLALATEGLFLLAQRFVVSPGVRRRARPA